MVNIHRHGTERVKERFGVPKRIAAEVADRARNDGLPRQAANGRLRRYLDALHHQHAYQAEPVVYSGRVWLYRWNTLITVLPLPVRYRTTAEQQLREYAA